MQSPMAADMELLAKHKVCVIWTPPLLFCHSARTLLFFVRSNLLLKNSIFISKKIRQVFVLKAGDHWFQQVMAFSFFFFFSVSIDIYVFLKQVSVSVWVLVHIFCFQQCSVLYVLCTSEVSLPRHLENVSKSSRDFMRMGYHWHNTRTHPPAESIPQPSTFPLWTLSIC